MDTLDQLRAFIATAQTGSFTGAADQLGISNRLTSKYVAELEARLGIRLFQRTTRKVGLTAAGEDLLARAPALLDDLDDLLAGVAENTRGFTGVIRISAPVILGEIYVGGMLGRFAQRNPGLTVDLRLSDRYSDLASEGIDLAFRIGQSEMLSLKTRKLGSYRAVAVASPAYLEAHGAPRTLQDLARHECIIDTNSRALPNWIFHRDGVEVPVPVRGRFHVNSARAAAQLAEQGLGIAYVPRFALGGCLTDGRLTPVLTDYDCQTGPITAVYLQSRTLPRKVRALIDFATEDIRRAGVL